MQKFKEKKKCFCELWVETKRKMKKRQKKSRERERLFFFSKSKIRACGGGRYGRADMIQRGQRDVMWGTSWRNEPLMIPLGIQSHGQQRMRRDSTVLIRRGGQTLQSHSAYRHDVSRHLICFLWPFSTPTASHNPPTAAPNLFWTGNQYEFPRGLPHSIWLLFW